MNKVKKESVDSLIQKKIKEIEHIHFSEKDVVRHPLVTKIVKCYNKKKERR